MGIVTHKLIDNKVVEFHKVIIKKLTGDFMIPNSSEIYARGLLYNWRSTDAGNFVFKHAVGEVTYEIYNDPALYQAHVAVIVTLEKKKLSEYYMRFDKA